MKIAEYCVAGIQLGDQKRHVYALFFFMVSSLLKKLFYFESSLLLGLFSSCGMQGLLSSCSAWAAHCSGFSY